MSTAFIIGGYIYISILLSYFNIDVPNYYSILDYLSSSISIIPSILFTTAFAIFFFFIGMFDAINSDIIETELDIKKEKTYNIFIYISLVLSISMFVRFYLINEINYLEVQMLSLMILFIIIDKIKIHEYIKNYRTFILMIYVSYIFFSSLVVKSYDKISSIESGKYKSNYSITFIPKYKEFKDMQLITMNSKYLFLWNEDKEEVVIIPSASIKFTQVINK